MAKPAPASIDISGDVTQFEGNGGTIGYTFTVTLTGKKGGKARTVDWSVGGDTTDLTGALSGTLTFAKKQTTQYIVVYDTGDFDVESDTSFSVNLSNATNS